MWYAEGNHSFMFQICAKGFLDSNFNKAVDKISIFHEITQNFTYSQKPHFFKYKWNFLDQVLLPYKFKVGKWEEYSFSFLPVVSR